jgi:hypothetical protein
MQDACLHFLEFYAIQERTVNNKRNDRSSPFYMSRPDDISYIVSRDDIDYVIQAHSQDFAPGKLGQLRDENGVSGPTLSDVQRCFTYSASGGEASSS